MSNPELIDSLPRVMGAVGLGLDWWAHTGGIWSKSLGLILTLSNPNLDINITGTMGHAIVLLAFLYLIFHRSKNKISLIAKARRTTFMARFGISGLVIDLYSHADPLRSRDLTAWQDVLFGAGDMHFSSDLTIRFASLGGHVLMLTSLVYLLVFGLWMHKKKLFNTYQRIL